MRCQDLITAEPDRWARATSHPFLEGCRDGSLEEEPFNTWLVQDFRFVQGFVRFAGALLRDAPNTHLDTLLGGCAALHDELAWFMSKMAERGLNPATEPQPACRRYTSFLDDLHPEPYPVRAVGFWAIEKAYNQAWTSILPVAEPFRGFAQRWGSPAFGDYVAALERQADQTLVEADNAVHHRARDVFQRVADEELDFWQMAFEGGD